MPLEPLVDPMGSRADRAAPGEAHVAQLQSLAGHVDRVAADAGVLRGVLDRQPGPHGPSSPRGSAQEQLSHPGRRCIPPGGVARRLHTPGTRTPHALPGGRLDAQDDRPVPARTLSAE